jgi:4-amino-4-deoxy-L-arabinose transferase-like glycosyltransferase
MKIKFLAILSIIILGSFLRFYNLNWGAPFYFHPDERNIASLISSLNFYPSFDFFTKGTFAYGTFLSYLVFFLTGISKTLLIDFGFRDIFSQSIISLRILSSASSVFTIVVLIYIGSKFWNIKVGILTGILVAFSPGLIQTSHFGTFESFIVLMYVLIFWTTLLFAKNNKIIYFFLATAIIAIASAVKINSLILFMIPFLFLINNVRQRKIASYKAFPYIFISVAILFSLTILFSSYYITTDFRNSLVYESGLLSGTLQVFYTGEFFNTIPIVYSFINIYPFLINPALTVLFIGLLFFMFHKALQTKSELYLMPIVFFLILFLPEAFLFAKWTRYMVPTLPFMYLMLAITFESFLRKKTSRIKYPILSAIIFINIVFGVSYFIAAFVNQDTRIEASFWAKKNIPTDSNVLSEVYDLGIVPFNQHLQNISLFNFYDLDTAPSNNLAQLQKLLSSNDYLILPSQRILKIRLRDQNKFPNGYKFYSDLLSGKLGYQKIYETPCDIFCKITYLNSPSFSFEETANVFDRPTVLIFKKI